MGTSPNSAIDEGGVVASDAGCRLGVCRASPSQKADLAVSFHKIAESKKKQNASDFLKGCQTDCCVISGPRHLSEKQICLSNQLFDRR